MTENLSAIKIDCRSFKYSEDAKNILNNFSMEIEYGKITLISGFSGSGKTTLISLINGIIPRVVRGIFDGEVYIDGENISTKTMSQITRKVGSVLQNAESQIINQVVEDEIAFGCENFGFESEKISELVTEGCNLMKLEPTWKTRTLSGGQKQRVVTASTLAMQGKILIFDEPLANLDVIGAKILLDNLKVLAQSEKAIILVEHRLDIILPYVDKIWKIEDGVAQEIQDKNAYLKSQINVIEDSPKNRLKDGIENERILLELDGVSKSFGKKGSANYKTVLNNINEKIYDGERVLLCGENGCGKSTLLTIVARLSKQTFGKINVFEQNENMNDDLAHGASSVEKKILKTTKFSRREWFRFCGFVYQNPNYQLFMSTVRDEILFGVGKSVGNEQTDYALDIAHRLELDDLLDRHPHSLSEGQKRRVTIAAILAQRPKLLLLDEPTVGQDYHTLEILMKVLNEVHVKNHNTMISVTHDIRCVDALCDRKIFLGKNLLEN